MFLGYKHNCLNNCLNLDTQVVIVQNPKYLKKLSPIIEKASARTISNYLMWRIVDSSLSDLNQEAGKIRERYNKAVKGINSDPPRWKKCTKEVGFNSLSDSTLRVVASSMYLQGYFTIYICFIQFNKYRFLGYNQG